MNENNDNTIWNELISRHFIQRKNHNDSTVLFIKKICQNDFEYIAQNYQTIECTDIKKECFNILVAYSKNINIINFIIEKFNINEKCYDDCFVTSLMFNNDLDVIKYFFEKFN